MTYSMRGTQKPPTGTESMKGEPRYRSGLEKRVCEKLRARGIKFYYEPYQLEYTTEVKTGLCPNCGHNVMLKKRHYTPDLVLQNGTIIEIKGKFTGEMRTKMIAVAECNPELEIKMLFQRDGWITKKKRTSYTQWCRNNGFDYAVGEDIPDEWIY